MSMLSVEDAKTLKIALVARAEVFSVVVPMYMERDPAVVVGAKKLGSMVSSKSHACPI